MADPLAGPLTLFDTQMAPARARLERRAWLAVGNAPRRPRLGCDGRPGRPRHHSGLGRWCVPRSHIDWRGDGSIVDRENDELVTGNDAANLLAWLKMEIKGRR